MNKCFVSRSMEPLLQFYSESITVVCKKQRKFHMIMLLLCVCCLLFAHVITHTIYFMIRCWFFSYCSLQVFIHFRVSVTCKIKSSADLLRSNVHLFSFSLSLIHNRYLRSIPSAYEMCSLYCTFGQFLLSMKAHETAILLHIFLNVVNMFNQTQ